MSEHTQSSERLSKDPVRIVYHAENRTFARLFNEHSLDQVKDVVRRKLGLGRGTDVSLKQMRSDALLDLEDDDDFQAFRVLLRSSVSVDIQVTVGTSRGSTVPPPVAPQPQQSSVSEPTTTSLASPSRRPARSAASGESSAHPEVARPIQVSAAAIKTPESSARKRKVSFDNAALVASVKSAGRPVSKKATAVPPVASAESVESPAAPRPVGPEEPPKKRQKKEATKAKDVQPTEVVQSSPTKASDAPKPKPKKSAALDRGDEAGTSAPKEDAVTSEPPAKGRGRRKKDDDAGLKKSSAPIPVDQDGIDQPINQPNDSVNEASLEPASEKPKRTITERGAPKTRKPRPSRGTVCASIPQTSESTTVRSEVAAAILSDYLTLEAELIPPKPPAKRKYVRKDTKKSSASSSALPVESTTVLGAPANELPNVPTERRLEHVVPPNEPNSPPCPICLEEPFHIRYCCPTVLKGPDAIRERLEKLKRTNMGDQQSLIKELEALLRESKVTSKPSLDATSTDGVQSREVSPPPSASPPRTPTIPSNSYVSEVTVESRDEGSSSESSDDMSEGGVEHKELPASRRLQAPDEQPSPANDDLEAVIRGPASKRQSVLRFIDRIVGDDDDEGSDSEEEEVEVELDEDPDEEIDRSRRRLSRHTKHSSDSESEDEESRSSSPSRSAVGISNNPQPGVQRSDKPAEEPAKHQDSDIVMRDSADPPVPEGQDDDSSEQTHVGSEDRMDVDHGSIGEKRAAATVEEQSSSPAGRASALPLSDASSIKPQESGQTSVGPTCNRDGGVPVSSEAHNEVEADPIEPADDLESPTISRSLNADPIEAPSEVAGLLSSGATQSAPKPGVTKRIKTRKGQIPNDEAERPVLLEQLASEATDEVTPFPAKGKSRRKNTEVPASQEPAPTRRSPRFNSLPPPTSTPAAVVLLNHRSKVGARVGKAAKTPANRSEEQLGASQSAKDDAAQNGARIRPTTSLVRWEMLTEPSSPSLQPNETSMHVDELMSSSPQPDDIPKGRSRKSASSRQAEKGKERLFDLSSSQIPFPYSQHQSNPTPTAVSNGKEKEAPTDSEEEPKVSKKKAKAPVRYRSLSHLASQATLFSPSLPTPANKSVTNGETKKRVADEDSSSSSSDADEVTGSGHIPRGRRAGSVFETKKMKSLLSRI